jgi:hypothetical protein
MLAIGKSMNQERPCIFCCLILMRVCISAVGNETYKFTILILKLIKN